MKRKNKCHQIYWNNLAPHLILLESDPKGPFLFYSALSLCSPRLNHLAIQSVTLWQASNNQERSLSLSLSPSTRRCSSHDYWLCKTQSCSRNMTVHNTQFSYVQFQTLCGVLICLHTESTSESKRLMPYHGPTAKVGLVPPQNWQPLSHFVNGSK